MGIIAIFKFFHKYKLFQPKIIAEIGCNHQGDINIAKRLVAQAALSGADYVKFQKRSIKYLLKINIIKNIRLHQIHFK